MNIKSEGRPPNENYKIAKRIVADVKEKNPKLSPAKIRKETSKRISQWLREKYPKGTDQDIELWSKDYLPSTSWIRDYIKEDVEPAIKNIKKSGINRDWHLGSLREHELYPAVVPILLKEQARRTKGKYDPLTTWQSLWASRLYSTIATSLARNKKAIPESLVFWSGEYTIAEKISLYTKTDFDTSELDADLLKHPDMSEETWDKEVRERKAPSFYPPSRFGWTPPSIDFARRDKLRKQRDLRIAKDTKEHEEEDNELIEAIRKSKEGETK